jgi:hypothetical protein
VAAAHNACKPLTRVLPRLLLRCTPGVATKLRGKVEGSPRIHQYDWSGLKFFREFEIKKSIQLQEARYGPVDLARPVRVELSSTKLFRSKSGFRGYPSSSPGRFIRRGPQKLLLKSTWKSLKTRENLGTWKEVVWTQSSSRREAHCSWTLVPECNGCLHMLIERHLIKNRLEPCDTGSAAPTRV